MDSTCRFCARWSCEKQNVALSCGWMPRFVKKTSKAAYDARLYQLGATRTENVRLCALGNISNGLISCRVSQKNGHIIHDMPMMGSCLQTRPPTSEQVICCPLEHESELTPMSAVASLVSHNIWILLLHLVLESSHIPSLEEIRSVETLSCGTCTYLTEITNFCAAICLPHAVDVCVSIPEACKGECLRESTVLLAFVVSKSNDTHRAFNFLNATSSLLGSRIRVDRAVPRHPASILFL